MSDRPVRPPSRHPPGAAPSGRRAALAPLAAAIVVAILALALGLALALALAAPLAAQSIEPPEIGVGLIGHAQDLTPGARVTWKVAPVTRYDPDRPLRTTLAADVDLPFTLDAADNPESLIADASWTLFYVWQKEPPGDDPMAGVRQLGYFRLGLQLQAEALQQLDDADLSAGLTFLYTHPTDALWFLPALEADVGYAGCVGCDLPDGEDPGAWRLDVTADWSIPLAAVMPAPLDPLRLRPGGRVFTAWGMGPGLEALRNDEGAWARIELAYTVQGIDWLHELHVGWRGGEVPVRLREENAWSVGATFVM